MTTGLENHSLSVLAIGLSILADVTGSAALIWRFRAERRQPVRSQAAETRAAIVVAAALAIASTVIITQAAVALATGSRPGTSSVTLIAAGISLAVLTPLAHAKRHLIEDHLRDPVELRVSPAWAEPAQHAAERDGTDPVPDLEICASDRRRAADRQIDGAIRRRADVREAVDHHDEISSAPRRALVGVQRATPARDGPVRVPEPVTGHIVAEAAEFDA